VTRQLARWSAVRAALDEDPELARAVRLVLAELDGQVVAVRPGARKARTAAADPDIAEAMSGSAV
jgi:hypothetical protein